MTTRFTKKCFLLCMLLAVLGLLPLGCGNGDGFVDGPVVSVARRFEDLEFTLSLPKSRYVLGEEIPMYFVLKNVGTKTIEILSAGGAPYQFQALSGSKEVWLSSRAGGGGSSTITIAPNSSKTFDTIWLQRTPTGSISDPFISSGKYLISVWLIPASIDGKYYSPEQKKTDLAANPLEIVIQTP